MTAILTKHLVDLSPAPVHVDLPLSVAATVLSQVTAGLLLFSAQMKTHHQVQHTDHHHGHKIEAYSCDLHDHVIDPQGLQYCANS